MSKIVLVIVAIFFASIEERIRVLLLLVAGFGKVSCCINSASISFKFREVILYEWSVQLN